MKCPKCDEKLRKLHTHSGSGGTGYFLSPKTSLYYCEHCDAVFRVMLEEAI